MSEMALTADHLIIIGRGRLLADVSMADLTTSATSTVRVRSPRAGDLAPLLAGPDVTVTPEAQRLCRSPGCPAPTSPRPRSRTGSSCTR